MSMTLDALSGIHTLTENADIDASAEFLARRKGQGFKFSIFYGPMWLLIIAGLGGWYFQYRKKNPEKTNKFEQGLRGATGSAAQRLKGAVDNTMKPGGPESQQYMAGHPAASAVHPNTIGANSDPTKRFNPPPNWPTPPPGFVPDAGWQPDPSWPPAPPGWNFWVA